MVTGAHVILYSKDAERDRDFLRDVLKLPHVDAGHGWLIFGLPPSEVAVHPSDGGEGHALYLLCDDVREFVAQMKARNTPCGAIEEQRWGSLTHLTLPGGGQLGVYQPKHARPKAVRPKPTRAPQKRTRKPKAKAPDRVV
ncbi:MAG: VOC family protein [Myxococcaceae bacterium]